MILMSIARSAKDKSKTSNRKGEAIMMVVVRKGMSLSPRKISVQLIKSWSSKFSTKDWTQIV